MHCPDLADPAKRTLPQVLRVQAESIPDEPFVMCADRRFTYGRAHELSNSWAAGLARLGVGRGDTVAFMMKSCPEFVLGTFGVMKLGAIWVPTNVDYKGEWLRHSLADSRARVLVLDAELIPRVAEVAKGLPFEHVVVRGKGDATSLGWRVTPVGEIEALASAEPDLGEIRYDDTAAVLWTSGTTGRAKGVMQSHNAWIRGALSGAENAGTREGDILYCCLPMYNSAAWVASVYRALVTGLPMALDEEFSASRFWEFFNDTATTEIYTLGAMHMFLWNAPPRPDDADNPVRHASMIPMPDAIREPFMERFGIETLDQGYGQSEMMGLLHRRDDGRRWKPNSLGEPLPGLEIKLLDDDDLEVPQGAVGEFCVRPAEPAILFNGYFRNPEATLAAFRNLWYHTGDLGRRDEEGDWFFVDRKADFIRYKGRNVSSFAVEAAVGAHPAVLECAAHGVTSAELDSEAEIKVCVVLREGEEIQPEALVRFVNENAPYFFVPRYVEFVDELPHTPTGRVQKFKLRERGLTPETWDRVRAGVAIER
jgi:crotonobetaine/carnitine-CoA ligase